MRWLSITIVILTGLSVGPALAEKPQAAAAQSMTGKDGAPMVPVPAGEFLMGSKDGDHDEQPVHKVFEDAFYRDKYEVTAAQYAKFLAASGRQPPARWNELNLANQGDRPVVGVDWNDAQAYCSGQFRGRRESLRSLGHARQCLGMGRRLVR